MKQDTVTFDFISSADFEYSVTARITPGKAAPAQNFDRFQEPDDSTEVEIIKVVDENGVDIPVRRLEDSTIEEMEAKAIEEWSENGSEYPDFF